MRLANVRRDDVGITVWTRGASPQVGAEDSRIVDRVTPFVVGAIVLGLWLTRPSAEERGIQ